MDYLLSILWDDNTLETGLIKECKLDKNQLNLSTELDMDFHSAANKFFTQIEQQQ